VLKEVNGAKKLQLLNNRCNNQLGVKEQFSYAALVDASKRFIQLA
jgi:hypothetical protein